jgi:hypothetical protein
MKVSSKNEREHTDMPTSLRITSRLHVTPLLDIHHPPFAKLYRDGVYWSFFKERHNSPLTDRYMLDNLRATLRETDVDGQQAYWLPVIGFHFGRLHGAILSAQTGNPRPDVTALAHFHNDTAVRGYDVGRDWYFVEALIEVQPDERIYTDSSLLERLQELERNSIEFHEEEDTWYYSLGCILGELSGQLFPATSVESARWETDRRLWAQSQSTPRREVDADSLDPVPVVEYTV